MNLVLKIIPRVYYLNKITGTKASPFGACPWVSESDKENWDRIEDGFTYLNSDGSVGRPCGPAKTMEEAKETMKRINERVREYHDAWKRSMKG